LAKIKLRIGDNEIEIDSRDFYVDNNTIRKVIEDISALLQESSARIMPHSTEYGVGESNALSSLENAEVYEPEFGEPVFATNYQFYLPTKKPNCATFVPIGFKNPPLLGQITYFQFTQKYSFICVFLLFIGTN